MAVIKDLVLTIVFLCMFGVLLCFVHLQNELRSSVIQNDVTINTQVKVIQSSFELSTQLRHKVNSLKVDVIDLREVLLVLQKKEEISGDEVRELKLDITRLKRNKRKLLYQIEKLEKEIREKE